MTPRRRGANEAGDAEDEEKEPKQRDRGVEAAPGLCEEVDTDDKSRDAR